MRHWSQEELAHACGLHRTYISAIEQAKCNVGLDNVEKLALAFVLECIGIIPDGREYARRPIINKYGESFLFVALEQHLLSFGLQDQGSSIGPLPNGLTARLHIIIPMQEK